MVFKLWSELNRRAREELKPNLGLRSWNFLTEDEKYKIWKHLEFYFFDSKLKKDWNNEYRNDHGLYFQFFGSNKEEKIKRIYLPCIALNKKYKVKSYAKNFLEDTSVYSACEDFNEIFMNQAENVVIELISLYCRALILEREEETIYRKEEESNKQYQQRLEEWRWQEFDEFSKELNDVFVDFGINIHLTRQGFVPRQDEKIIKEIYEPVLGCLSHSKWKEVNVLLSDSFSEYRKNTPQGYSNCVTNVISAIQAFLQIIVNSKTGKGEISKLILEAQSKKMIPTGCFVDKIFKNIESILAQERQETGIAHPKKEYATEKNARLILNLAMIFFQYCIKD